MSEILGNLRPCAKAKVRQTKSPRDVYVCVTGRRIFYRQGVYRDNERASCARTIEHRFSRDARQGSTRERWLLRVSISWNETRVVRDDNCQTANVSTLGRHLHTERNRRLSKSFVYILRDRRAEKRASPTGRRHARAPVWKFNYLSGLTR